jgi:hypothetical protein
MREEVFSLRIRNELTGAGIFQPRSDIELNEASGLRAFEGRATSNRNDLERIV